MQAEPIPVEPCRIPLRSRDATIVAYALVDAADYEWLMRWTWRLHGGGYAVRNEPHAGKYRAILMHREILSLEPGDKRQGEHRNRDRLDCRRDNLRIAPRGDKDNHQNFPSYADSTSRYRGVYWDKRDRKWQADVMIAGKRHRLGYFDDEDEAGAAASAFRAAHMPFSEDAALYSMVASAHHT